MGWLFLLFSSIVLTLCQSPFPVKHLAGPPSEFPFHRVPIPEDTISQQRSASQLVWFVPGLPNSEVYTMDIPVDGPSEFAFSFTSPHAQSVSLELYDPQGKKVDLDSMKTEGFIPLGESYTIPSTTYIVPNAVRGHYTLTFYSSLPQNELAQLAASPYPNAVLTVINNDYLVIESHMSSYLIKVGQDIGIVSNIINVSPQANPGDTHITDAELEIITPDGKDIDLPMTDSYTKSGIPEGYSAHFTAKVPGEYIIQAKLEGWFANTAEDADIPFIRSTQQVIHVSAASVELTGTAKSRQLDASHLLIDIGTTGNGDRLRAYAEVLGVDHLTNEKKAACWIGGVVQITNNVVTLELDTNWLQLAGVTGPLTLQNVYLSDLDTTYPVSIFSGDIPVMQSETFQYKKPVTPITITKEMRSGRNPLKNTRNVTAPAAPSLLLLPGYCSKENPWQGSYAFTNGAYFNSGGDNLSNDKFALKVMDYIKSQEMVKFSIIGHSQGGMVALHLHNYYFTGLELATEGRLIQTVGTPWQGCTAAGDLANLGDLFGIGCGSNNDLSLDGAVNWLSGISTETRNHVHFYTTSYQQGQFFGDYCNLPINLILQWPNDGTTEIKYASLPGGVNLGSKQKWCHIKGMKYPAQFTDASRNAEMNAAAAR